MGYQKCCVCKKTSDKAKDGWEAAYYRLPNTPERKDKWIKRLSLEHRLIKKSSKVCGAHFEKSQIRHYRLVRKALPFSVPGDNNENQTTLRSTDSTANAPQRNVLQMLNSQVQLKGFGMCPNSAFNDDKDVRNKAEGRKEVDNCLGSGCSSKLLQIKNAAQHPSEGMKNLKIAPACASLGLMNSVLQEKIATSRERPQTFQCSRSEADELKLRQVQRSLKNSKRRIKRLASRQLQEKSSLDHLKLLRTCKMKRPEFYNWLILQLKHYTVKKVHSYTTSEKAVALSLYYSCGINGYRSLQKLGFKLPSQSQLRKWLEYINLQPGINQELLRLLKEQCDLLKNEDRHCVIMWDEMAIKECIQYDKNADKLEGIVDHGEGDRELESASEALVFLVSGIRSTWWFPVSFYFSKKNTTSDKLNQLLHDNISRLSSLGFQIRVGICDMSFTNQGLYKRMNVTPEKPFALIQNKKVYFLHDTPHLIKLVRNNLMTKSFTFKNTDKSSVHYGSYFTAKWKYILDFYKIDTNRVSRCAPKLTKLHVYVKDFSKMKVRLAVQVLSNSVAAGIKTMVSMKKMAQDACGTAIFVKRFDELFDLMNISSDNNAQKRERCVSKNATLPDCIRGLRLTTTGMRMLLQDLKAEGYEYVLTRKIQQDKLENLFSIIRLRGGWSTNPTARQFCQNIKYVFVKSFIRKSVNTNCESIEECANYNMRLLSSLLLQHNSLDIQSASETNEVRDNMILSEEYVNSDSESPEFYNCYKEDSGDIVNDNISIYIGSYCVKKIAYRRNCQSCKSLLDETLSESRPEHELSLNKSYSVVASSKNSSSFHKVISGGVSNIFKYLNDHFLSAANLTLCRSGMNISKSIQDYFTADTTVCRYMETSVVCKNHWEETLKLFVRVKLFRIISDKNEKWKMPKKWSQTRLELRNQ